MNNVFLAAQGMVKQAFATFLLVFCAITVLASQASANILISPTRVELGDRDRGIRMSVVNTSAQTKTYRIFWREQAQTPAGQFVRLERNQRVRGLNPASRIVRFSPSQITLESGERQHIRLSVRRPADLPDGDYRSYMVFEALPDPAQDKADESEGQKIEIKLSLAFAIPVLVRQGEADVSAKFVDVLPVQRMVQGEPKFGAVMKIQRQGKSASIGNIKIYWKPASGRAEKQVGVLNYLAIYSEAPHREIDIATPDITKAEDGTLRIVYEGAGAFEGMVFDEHEQKIKASDFILQE